MRERMGVGEGTGGGIGTRVGEMEEGEREEREEREYPCALEARTVPELPHTRDHNEGEAKSYLGSLRSLTFSFIEIPKVLH